MEKQHARDLNELLSSIRGASAGIFTLENGTGVGSSNSGEAAVKEGVSIRAESCLGEAEPRPRVSAGDGRWRVNSATYAAVDGAPRKVSTANDAGIAGGFFQHDGGTAPSMNAMVDQRNDENCTVKNVISFANEIPESQPQAGTSLRRVQRFLVKI